MKKAQHSAVCAAYPSGLAARAPHAWRAARLTASPADAAERAPPWPAARTSSAHAAEPPVVRARFRGAAEMPSSCDRAGT